jgi:hypothetical protein
LKPSYKIVPFLETLSELELRALSDEFLKMVKGGLFPEMRDTPIGRGDVPRDPNYEYYKNRIPHTRWPKNRRKH